MRKVLTFDDVALVPQYSNISSRTEPDLSTWLFKDKKIGMPLLAANMDTVICDDLADVLLANGGFPIFHRFTDIEQQRIWIKKYSQCSISTGLNNEHLEDFIGLGAKVITFDIAHGHCKQMLNEIEFIKTKYPHVDIIAGNVCTSIGTHDLISAGAGAVKVGVGPGCFTAGTLVTTSSGKKPIEKVTEGECVLTHTGQYKKVVGTLKRTSDKGLIKITVKGENIYCTPEHKIYVIPKHAKNSSNPLSSAIWVEAQNLTKDHLIVKIKSAIEIEFCEIDGVDSVDLTTFVYDIEVEEDHSYVVADNFVVHNSACTTRTTTGFGVSQFSAIQDCVEIARRFKIPIIADGGIRNSRDVVLALAAGASTVMIGKLFALTEQSAAIKRTTTRLFYEGDPEGDEPLSFHKIQIKEAKYRGQASKDFQDEKRGGLKKGTVSEGDHFWGEVKHTTQEMIDELLGGIRSALTYGGARTIQELQKKAEFVEVTNSYSVESAVRK